MKPQKEFSMAGKGVHEWTDTDFDTEVLKADTPVLVDFWAEWCAPCRMLGPTIDQLATEYEGKVKVGKVDTEVGRETAIKYRIQAIPTVLLFKGGVVKKQFVGLTGKDQFKRAIDELLVGGAVA